MSYQAITDIIVNPSKIQDLQLSNPVKDSQNSPELSFKDFIKEAQQSDDVKKEESVSEPKAESEGKADTTEKTEEKAPVADKVDEEKVSEADSGKDNPKNLKTENKKELSESEKSSKTEKVVKKEEKDSKKLSKKDLSRIDEIIRKDFEEAEVSKNTEKLPLVNQNIADSKVKTELKTKDSEEKSEDLLLVKGKSDMLQENPSIQAENKTEDFEFDFSGKNSEGKKEFSLDKNGKIKVEDLRTEPEVSEIAEKKPLLRTSEIKLSSENTAVISLELNPNAEADVLSLNTQTAAANGSNFQAMLSNQLHNVAPEFVKAGNLILKDNNQGTINLVLHPDDLGNVKIHLNLDGKTLSGHITVATKEALQVFKDNAETLREAFIKSGFDAADFDVAFNNGSQFNQNMDFGSQNDGTSLLAKHVYGNAGGGLDSELEDIFQNAEDISNYSVNIVA